jgi:hypothetical protein
MGRSTSLSAGSLSKPLIITSWVLQVASAAILGQTLFFKFTGAPEAVHIFTTLGVEPWGRIGTGVMELIAVVLLLVPRLTVFGAALSVGLMVGAVGSHLGPLGIEVKDDGGLLFVLGLIVLVACSVVLVIRRHAAFSLLGQVLRLLGVKKGLK